MTYKANGFGLAALILAAQWMSAPAHAQVDLSGHWAKVNQTDNIDAPDPVDLLGMPVNEDGRAKALSYNIAALSAPERQCQMYPPFYIVTGPFGMDISRVQDPITQRLVAWKLGGAIDRNDLMIWMDGRPHPSRFAPHEHGGFTTGRWEGDTLTSFTTHFKLGDIKRHRVFNSDRATITYRFNRHGDLLTVTGILEDPVYLAEPYVLTQIFQRVERVNLLPLSACEPIEELAHLHEHPETVPHYLPGENPFVNELTEEQNIPLEAVLGGPETMYPEFRKRIRDQYVLPPPCTDCGESLPF